jgi:hypothetical protein
LSQEIAQIKQDVSAINSNLLDIELLRDSAASSEVSPADIHPSLKQLQSLTTTIGQQVSGAWGREVEDIERRCDV